MRQNPKAIPFDALHQCIGAHGVSLVHCTHVYAEQAEAHHLWQIVAEEKQSDQV